MAIALDASTPAGVWADTAANTSLVTASFTPPSGSIVVAKVFSAGGVQTHTGVTGLTFTNRIRVGTSANSAGTSLWTATGGGSSVTVTAAFGGTAEARGLLVEVFTGAQLAATPATHGVALVWQTDPAAAPTDTITTTGTNSIVSWANSDWNGIDGTTRTYRSSATETGYHIVSGGVLTEYSAYQAAATAGSQTFGLTVPGGQIYAIAGIEIQAASAAATRTPARVYNRAAINRAANF